MAQGDFTKQEAEQTARTAKEMFEALPLCKKAEFAGHLNDILLFLFSARLAAPDESNVLALKPIK